MIFIVICLGFILKLKRMGIKAFLIELIVLAENMFSYGKNEEKFQFVVNHLYEIFPLWLKIILPKKMICYFVQSTFQEIKIALDYQKDSK